LHSKIVKGVLVVGSGESDITPIIIIISTVMETITKNVVFPILLVSYYCLYGIELQNKPLPTKY